MVSHVCDLGRAEDLTSDADTDEEYKLPLEWAHDDTNPLALLDSAMATTANKRHKRPLPILQRTQACSTR